MGVVRNAGSGLRPCLPMMTLFTELGGAAPVTPRGRLSGAVVDCRCGVQWRIALRAKSGDSNTAPCTHGVNVLWFGSHVR